jgi:phosphate transport system substrate-binding protein
MTFQHTIREFLVNRKFLFAIAGVAVLSLGTPVLAAQAKLLETGSSLVYPLMNIWVKDYQQKHPDVQITTQSTGSGTGISQAMNGTAQIGASDAYVSDAQIAQAMTLNIPLAISAQQINYNLPELSATEHLRLSGPVLAGIYTGTIHFWDDPAIKAINHALAAKLPHKPIIPVHRSDGSGDTFIFTQYLSDTTPSWKAGPGFGTSVNWPPVAQAVGANGNPGMVAAAKGAPYSIAYVGVSFLNDTNAAGLGYATLLNHDGNYVLPTEPNIAAAAAALDAKTPKDERISLIFAPGKNSYPIINYEYAVIKPEQGDNAAALKEFLTWAISPSGGNSTSYLSQVRFVALPASIVKLSQEQIAQIK